MKVLGFIALFIAASLADSITLIGTVRDFTPAHPDFERSGGTEINAIENQLDSAGKPVLKAGGHSSFTSIARFAEWYRDVEDVNIAIPVTITLNQIGSTNVYSFSSDAYYPINNQGFGNYYNGRNYHFTTEFRNTFTYQGGETFTFMGDDDVFVFVNRQKIIDLGGIHGPLTGSVSLDAVAASIGITIGNDYELVVFQAERHTVGSNFRIDTSIQLIPVPPTPEPEPGRDAYICEVYYPNFCAGEVQLPPLPMLSKVIGATCPADPVVQFTPNGPTYSFENFNLVSFDSFMATSGDVEGRAAVRNSWTTTDGYTIGYELRTGGSTAVDNSLPYSLVVGGNANYASGSIHPDGTGIPYEGVKEDIYIGGTFTAPQYLQDRRTGGPSSTTTLTDSFDNAQAYYTALSNAHSNTPYGSLATASAMFMGLTITCTDSSAEAYYVHTTTDAISSITYWTEQGCNPNAQIVFNIHGNTQLKFAGDNLYHRAEKVLYNVVDSPLVRVETRVRGTILAPRSQYLQPGMGVVEGHVIVANVQQAHQINRLTCQPVAPPPHPTEEVCPAFETECSGLNLPLANGVYSFRDFNVISFHNFVANTGDVEGRLIAADDITVGNGWSVGYELQTANNQPDNSLPYSIVAGRDITWGSGSVHPDGTGLPYPGAKEGIYAGRNFNGPQYLQDRRTGGPSVAPGLTNYFTAARSCYTGYQNTLAAASDNVQKDIYWSGCFIRCNDATSLQNSVSLTPAELSQFTYFSLDNCNFQASWTINIRGEGDVQLRGDSFPGPAGGVVYNVLGSGRTITVTETQLSGHLLAPNNVLHQTGGVIVGKVVAGDITASLQVNKQNNCPNPGSVEVSTSVSNAVERSASVPVEGDVLRAGDAVDLPNGERRIVIEAYADHIVLDQAVTLNQQDRLSVTIDGKNGRVALDVADDSSASVVSVAFVVLAIAALFF